MGVKKTFVTKEKLEEISRKYPTPFYLYDEAGIRANVSRVKKAFAWNPGYREFFAVKATPNPGILKILQEYDCGTDCASKTELMLSNALGFGGGKIMFSSNDTPEEEFAYAAKVHGIINLDDITHIDMVDKALGGKFPETMSCRFNPGGYFKMGNDIMDNPGDAKYGMTRDQIIEAFRILKSKGVKHFGIHAFLASNTVTDDYYPELAGQLFRLAVELRDKTGADIRFVNLSGGVGIAYRPEQRDNDILAIGEKVHKVYDEILVPAGMGDVAIYTEMGRFMLAPYGVLVTKAIHEKHIYKEYIGCDACAVNLMRPMMYGAYHHITVAGKEHAPCDHVYDVTGSLCENSDKFAIDRKLPKIDMGDYLIIHDAGAHGYSMGYNYNGKLKCAELLLKEDGSVEMIRRAETPRDYFATLDFTGVMDKMDPRDLNGGSSVLQ
ncbi:MAG: diaminopimelate decarboxylase [Lachnospiraceae bacterium]|jgi:diaminopimelate decarboxylase